MPSFPQGGLAAEMVVWMPQEDGRVAAQPCTAVSLQELVGMLNKQPKRSRSLFSKSK